LTPHYTECRKGKHPLHHFNEHFLSFEHYDSFFKFAEEDDTAAIVFVRIIIEGFGVTAS
jgi:hypothetical protein